MDGGWLAGAEADGRQGRSQGLASFASSHVESVHGNVNVAVITAVLLLGYFLFSICQNLCLSGYI